MHQPCLQHFRLASLPKRALRAALPLCCLQGLQAMRFAAKLEARFLTDPCDPCYTNPFLKGDTTIMPQRGVFVAQGE